MAGLGVAVAVTVAEAVVIGAGVGGLAVAIRLAVAGHRVTVIERAQHAGGKLAVHERDGFVFDIGPSLVTLPHVFDELFRLAGTSLHEQLTMVRLDPQFHYHWGDGRSLIVGDSGCDEPGYRAFVDHGKRIWDVSERTFFAGPMSGPVALARRLRRARDLTDIDALRTLDASARRYFDDPHMVQWAGRYATYSGSSPYAAPATLGCIAHVEQHGGCWYPMGGLAMLRDALVRVAERVGVQICLSTEVHQISCAGGRVTGVRLQDESLAADIVVANADAQHLYADLLPDARVLRRVRRAQPSTSAFVMMAGVRGRTTGIGHHNVWFSGDARAEFDQLADHRLADDPTVYACVSSVTDASQAPPGDENWFMLINVPARAQIDRQAYSAVVLDRLRRDGIDLAPRTAFTETLTPADFEQRYRSPGGAIYGSSSNGRRAAFVRPANRGAVRGLYLVGGSSHPGGGLPLVTMGARIVAGMIESDAR
ncbi:MAG: putative phytoene dehydrogenase [Ilumatobacteraceae bacterium]|nr:putative phytoene dehydrogenase [Ilumatobacteraceae bacterium]